MSVGEEIAALFGRRGAESYFGEPVSMLEHGLQAAHFATVEGAPSTLVLAALLHDVGHLLEDVPADIQDWRSDAHHEDVGAAWLERQFGAAVAAPVRLHVAAKRYLCATDPSYFARLSAASVHTLGLQGGPMSPLEVAAFEQRPYWREAVRLRHWDDQGKLRGFRAPGLETYRSQIDAAALPTAAR